MQWSMLPGIFSQSLFCQRILLQTQWTSKINRKSPCPVLHISLWGNARIGSYDVSKALKPITLKEVRGVDPCLDLTDPVPRNIGFSHRFELIYHSAVGVCVLCELLFHQQPILFIVAIVLLQQHHPRGSERLYQGWTDFLCLLSWEDLTGAAKKADSFI